MATGFGIETARLRLRELTLADAELMLAIWNDPAFIRFVGDRGIRTLEDAQAAMTTGALKLYEDYGYGPYGVVLRGQGTPIGICGLFRREELDEPDIGFATLPAYCGNGYAYEASKAVLEYARDKLGIPRLTAIVSPENEASVGLIRKLGLRFERMHRMADDDEDVAIYGIRLQTGGSE